MLVTSLMMLEIVGYSYDSYFTASWINCYVIGFFLPDLLVHFSKKSKIKLTVVLAGLNIPASIVWYILRYKIQPNLADMKYVLCERIINYCKIFSAIAILLFIWQFSEILINRSKSVQRVLRWSDKYSFDLYITHMIYIKGILSLMSITRSYILNIILMMFSTIISGILLNVVCSLIRNRVNVKECGKENVSSG